MAWAPGSGPTLDVSDALNSAVGYAGVGSSAMEDRLMSDLFRLTDEQRRGIEPKTVMIDATYQKAHRTASSLRVKKGIWVA